MQAVGIPFVIVWEPSPASGLAGGNELECGEDGFDNEFTSEEEVAATITRVLGLKVPICPEKVVGRWTLLRSVACQAATQGQGQQTQKDGKEGQNKKDKEEVAGTLVIGDNEERSRGMARMLGFQPEWVVSSEEVERMWEKQAAEEAKEQEEKKKKREVDVVVKMVVEKEEQKTEEHRSKQGLSRKPSQNQGHLQKPRLSLRNRLSCPFDDMKVVESLTFSPNDKIDEESTDGDDESEEQTAVEKKEEENQDDVPESPTSTTSSASDAIQAQYIPVKHSERTVAYVPVSPTSSTASKKDLECPVTRVTSIIFFSPPSAKTWDRDVRVVSKLCQSQGIEAPKLYIVQKPGELRRGSLASSSESSKSSSTSSTTPSPTFSTSPSESSLATLATTTSTVSSQATTAYTAESVPSKRQFKLTVSRTTSDWIRDVTTHWRATNPNLPEKAKLPYYLIDPLTCALQVLEIGRQRAQSTIWARANLPVHLRQTLRLETLYIVDSGEQPSRLFTDLNGAKGGGGNCSWSKQSACSDPDADLKFQRYLASLGVDVIPAQRCRRLLMSDVYKVEKRVQELGYAVRQITDAEREGIQDGHLQSQEPAKVHDAGEGESQVQKTAHQRRTSWFKHLITGGKPRSKGRNFSGSQSHTQAQAQRPSTSSSSNNTRNRSNTKHSNSSATNLTINSTNTPNIPPSYTGTGGGIPRSTTFPNITPNTTTAHNPNTNTHSDTKTTRYTSSATATTARFYSPTAVEMVVSRSRTQKTRDINTITAFCHSNNIEGLVKYAVNQEFWECVDAGLKPVWPVGWPTGVDDAGSRKAGF